jgi:hypothetical protein
METKKQQKKQHGVEIQFSSISPLELWKKLELEQLPELFAVQNPTEFEDEESKRAFEAFSSDFIREELAHQEPIISSEKGSIFIWALLKEESKKSPLSKLSSKKILFKDNLFKRICGKIKAHYPKINFSKRDFEDVILYLEGRRLVLTSSDGIRITQYFAPLFHDSYKAWLVF